MQELKRRQNDLMTPASNHVKIRQVRRRIQMNVDIDFTVEIESQLIRKAAAANIDIGPGLDRFSGLDWMSADEKQQCVLIAVTESRTKDEIDRLVAALSSNR